MHGAKAPAKRITQHARAIQEQHGPAAAREQLGGVLATSDKNAARHLESLVRRFDLSLRVPISEYVHTEGGDTAVLPYLRPSNMLPKILTTHPDLLLGGFPPGEDAQRMMHTFWTCYREEHLTHPVIQRGPALWSRTIPVVLHGDGGRTAKKQPLECVTIEAVLGIDSAAAASSSCSCPTCMQVGIGDPSDPAAQRLSNRHAAYLSKFLIFSFPSKKYKAMPTLLIEMHRVALCDLADICSRGVLLAGTRYFFAVTGYKGDLEYHNKVVQFKRTYLNLGKIREIGCCPECAAGTPGTPFEDPGVDASWTRTICQDFPWRTPPPVVDLEFDSWHSLPTKAPVFFRRDAFHIFRHGSLDRSFNINVAVLVKPIARTYV